MRVVIVFLMFGWLLGTACQSSVHQPKDKWYLQNKGGSFESTEEVQEAILELEAATDLVEKELNALGYFEDPKFKGPWKKRKVSDEEVQRIIKEKKDGGAQNIENEIKSLLPQKKIEKSTPDKEGKKPDPKKKSIKKTKIV